MADASGAPSPEALVDRADDALYQAKSAGRNCVRQGGPEVGETPAGVYPEDANPVGHAPV